MRVRYPYLNNSQIVTAGKKRDEQLEKTPESEIYIQSILSINSSKRREINSDGRELWRNSEISRFNLPINTPDRYNRNWKWRSVMEKIPWRYVNHYISQIPTSRSMGATEDGYVVRKEARRCVHTSLRYPLSSILSIGATEG